jgi:hypothetical protein
VWSLFDFAVVVANAGDATAEVTVERGGMPIGGVVTIPPDELRTIYLPWIPELKGPDADTCGSTGNGVLSASTRLPDGAYHLSSSLPVTVYQFSALEYAPQGGPPGKSWAGCPAAGCTMAATACYSYSNDASLLLPSTAMTKNYRVTGYTGWGELMIGGTIAVTGTEDDTTVNVQVSPTGALQAGAGLAATGARGILTFPIARGEVVQLIGTPTADLSGTLVQSDKPVQVITGSACTQVPYGTQACDHIEESVFPAETLGTHYFVAVPTSPSGAPVAHLVRIYGNADGTQLTYPQGKPDGFPDVIDAGEVYENGLAMLVVQPFSTPPFYWNLSVTTDFEVVGDHEFAVASFQFGAQALSGTQVAAARGDPAQSLVAAVEQYRRKYVFLAPTDYPVNFVDVVQPMAAEVLLDGAPPGGTLTPLGTSGYGVRRVPLGPGNGGAHVMTSAEPFGIQVMGYGEYTSYQYPGGLNLEVIAPPPPPVG